MHYADNGKPIRFCQTSCLKVFVQDPETLLSDLGITLASTVDPSHPVAVDFAHRVSAGYQAFFLPDLDAKRKFESDVTKQLRHPCRSDRPDALPSDIRMAAYDSFESGILFDLRDIAQHVRGNAGYVCRSGVQDPPLGRER